jgi:segregation and condensation protein B
MEREKLWSILESLLFASERPLGLRELRSLFGEIEARELREAVEALAERLRGEGRGFELAEVAGGWQLRTSPANAEWVRKLLGARPVRLSRAALETLAIVAYRQPVTRAEIEDVRGVDSGGVLKLLLDRRLVKMLGKKEEVGRPILYGTTKDFLEFFGLRDLTQLPTLREFQELTDESAARLEEAGFEPASETGPLAGAAPETPPADPSGAAADPSGAAPGRAE